MARVVRRCAPTLTPTEAAVGSQCLVVYWMSGSAFGGPTMTDSANLFVMALPSFASRESYQNSDVKLGGRDWWAFDNNSSSGVGCLSREENA